MGTGISPNCFRIPYSLSHSHKPVLYFQLRNVTETSSDVPCWLFYRFAPLRMPRVKSVISCAVSDRGYLKSEQIWKVKHDILEPSVLGIQPEPPSWPERDEILRLRFERKVNSVELPLSIRMIKKKLQCQKGFKEETSEFTCYCSVNKTFSSMLFIIHQLQSYALQMRESLCCDGPKGDVAEMQRGLDASFLWLFQEVFSKTPSLMIYVMVLVAKFSLFSLSNKTFIAVRNNKQLGLLEECGKELTEEENMLWNVMLQEASTWQKELGTEVLDHETMLQFVAPMSVQLEGDHQYEEYVKTRLYYRKHLNKEPYNSLLLSNFAQFLYLVIHDLDEAEEYFKRSVMVEPPDAEAFSRYADFSWLVKNDLLAAEQRYEQALEADPGNNYYASKYANFLWSTGAKDTYFPLESSDNLHL
ncbi:unnamed protein product [Lupinus luteus]|uniref:Uncharacterized protein n=1 Tax=Lupinus luteus TaxID=3873 RepID=A0AAV1VXB9_LUPLU